MSTSKEESERRLGTNVEDKWRLDALIGYSSVAATYKARHRNGNEAALKIIHRSHCEFAHVVERFLHEARLANRVGHPGVERVFDDGTTEDGCTFLVMELLEGESLELRRVGAGGRLRLGEARPIFDGLLDAIVAIHTAGVIHRNLRPGNIFLTKDGRVVLTDFGRARLADDAPQSPLAIDGLVMGSPAYMAPEQARGKRNEVDARSDLWSVGAILFTVLTGVRIHEGATSQEKLAHAQTKPAPPIASVLSGVNPALAAVIDRALAFDRESRWPTASEMRRAYWLATGRDESTLPKERERKQSATAKQPSEPPTDWEAMGWPPDTSAAPPKQRPTNPDLHPPPLSAFMEVEPSATVIARGKRKRRARKVLIGATVFVVGLIAGVLAVTCAEGRQEQPAIEPRGNERR